MSSDTNKAFSIEEQQQQLQRQLGEKPVTTKDIANLYSHLQTMIDNVPKSPRLELDGPNNNSSNSLNDNWNPSFPITPTASSNLLVNGKNSLPTSPSTSTSSLALPSRKKGGPKEPDCPCHHILVSKDSKYCALCDDVIPILSEIQQDREKKRLEIRDCKASLSSELQKSEQFQKNIDELNKKSAELTEKLNTTTKQYNSLQKDMSVLQQKLEHEKSMTEKAVKEKASLESELEDLSQKLFEEANGMVATEKREKHQIENQLKHLQEEYRSCREQLEAVEMQLKELKLKMSDMEERHKMENRLSGNMTEDQQSSLNEEENEPDKRASRDLAGLFTHHESSKTSVASISDNEIDPLIFNEFQDFVDSEDRKLHSIPFMKNCLLEDVEPCLRFGPNSRLNPKKLSEAIAANACFIEEAPYGFAKDQAKRPYDVPLKISAAKNMIWERLSSAPVAPFAGCQACGRNSDPKIPLQYRFRISVLDDWACIDRYCRDRLVAVCEFYLFIRNIRHGYYNGRTKTDLYQECTRLKLQMFYARMGALSQMLKNIGVKGDTVGQASGPNMVIPSPIAHSPDADHVSELTSSQVGTEDDDEDSLTVSDKRSSMDSMISNSSNEDDKYFEDIVTEKKKSHRTNSIHPGNSVWMDHSLYAKIKPHPR